MITIKLTFTKDDLQGLLNAASFGDNPLQIDDLTKTDLKRLKADLEDSDFISEIVDTAEDACANDWLCDWSSNRFEDQ